MLSANESYYHPDSSILDPDDGRLGQNGCSFFLEGKVSESTTTFEAKQSSCSVNS